jgi:hypothetical protein
MSPSCSLDSKSRGRAVLLSPIFSLPQRIVKVYSGDKSQMFHRILLHLHIQHREGEKTLAGYEKMRTDKDGEGRSI